MAQSFEDTDMHNEAIRRLCLVCTGLIKHKHFDVDEFSGHLCRGLKIPELLPDVTLHNFFKKLPFLLKIDFINNNLKWPSDKKSNFSFVYSLNRSGLRD